MPLAANTRLGPYEILGPLGAGGMGEVYRARDTRLDRVVAVKILPPQVAAREDLRQRFEREARAVSGLNHPHICTLHDIGRQDGVDYLVMEYLEGETLAARLSKGPLPVAEALRHGIEISSALEQAHRHGVIHRDLKPGNVMLTKTGAKLLDFGLAKLREPPVAPTGASAMPTQTMPVTAEGTIVGTLQYMAPEQLEGKEADARTDIFACGAVLFEMVTGRKAFEGQSQASLISAVMTTEPPAVSALQPLSPPALDHVIRKCLAKDPEERWQSAHDLAGELKWIEEGGSQAGIPVAVATRRARRERVGWIAAAALLLAVVTAFALGVVRLRQAPPQQTEVRFTVPPPEDVTFRWADVPVVSPDGKRIVFGGQSADRKNPLWVRPLNSLAAQMLPGTEGGHLPFWSPDSRSIAFFVGRQLKKIDPSGGPPQTLCELPGTGSGGTWNRDGVIIAGTFGQTPLYQVPAAGGQPKPVTALDASRQERGHRYPCFLQDGSHFLYLAQSARAENTGIYVGSLDSRPPRRLLAADSNVTFAAPGYVLFAQGQTLMAQPLDTRQFRVAGESFPVAEQLLLFSGSVTGGAFSVSESGVLCYRQGSLISTQFAWFDRAGTRLGTLGETGLYANPALSPDEKRLATDRLDPQTNRRDIWVFDLARGTSTRLTFDPSEDFNSLWSPDGQRIAFTSERKGVRDIYHKLASGAGEDDLLFESGEGKSIEDWTRDGRFIIFNAPYGSNPDVWALPVSPGASQTDRKPVLVVSGPGSQTAAQVSPDGRWIAYESDESGRYEVYVQSFPASGGKWQISTAGGAEPRWRGDSKELFYVARGKLMAVEVKTGASTFEAGIPRTLFAPPLASDQRRNRYVVTADGKRFLVRTPVGETSMPITVVMNWTAAVKR